MSDHPITDDQVRQKMQSEGYSNMQIVRQGRCIVASGSKDETTGQVAIDSFTGRLAATMTTISFNSPRLSLRAEREHLNFLPNPRPIPAPKGRFIHLFNRPKSRCSLRSACSYPLLTKDRCD